VLGPSYNTSGGDPGIFYGAAPLLEFWLVP